MGTAPMSGAQTEEAVADGLRAGYRLIDTGAAYGNEAGVGRALSACGIPREEVFVVTKLPGRDHGCAETLASFEQSRLRLGVEYVDGYLIHWPLPRLDRYVDSWRAMIKLREEGLIRSIGVSNFTAGQLDRLEAETGVVPAVNQVEMHPGFPPRRPRASAGPCHAGGSASTPRPTRSSDPWETTPALPVLEQHALFEQQSVPLGNSVSWCELGFAAGSVAWLAPSRGAAVAGLPVGEVPVRPAGGAGPL
jgi:2,5-diketo-D-gluconate reductase A